MKWLLLTLWCFIGLSAQAHEVRPAYLELHEDRPGEFQVLWKTPMRGDMRLSLSPSFSGKSELLTPVATRLTGSAAVQTWRVKTHEPLRGTLLSIAGLDSTMTDALVRIEFNDGTTWTRRLTPHEPSARVPEQQTTLAVASEYAALGIEHILFGIDHLLFVLALLLITNGRWMLVKTVTAFTVAHSITLALAVLGFVHVPQTPVEAVIALSIVFVAAEILRTRDGHAGITARAPWLVAFTFGLLHGFGFAGALTEIGLPQSHSPIALLFFNIGVEFGQLMFIAGVLTGILLLRRIRFPEWVGRMPPYAIGSIAMFWTIQRIAAF
jgi:hydrogenase/urease accessory protein HupE